MIMDGGDIVIVNGIIHAIHANSRTISSVFVSPQICNQYILTQWIIFKFKGLIDISYIFYFTLAVDLSWKRYSNRQYHQATKTK